MFSKLDIDDERDREKELSNLSARPVFAKMKIEDFAIKEHSSGRFSSFAVKSLSCGWCWISSLAY